MAPPSSTEGKSCTIRIFFFFSFFSPSLSEGRTGVMQGVSHARGCEGGEKDKFRRKKTREMLVQ